MKLLQINGYESPGRRFSGLSLTPLLAQRGVESRHVIWERDSDNPEVVSLKRNALAGRLNQVVGKVERALSLQSVLPVNGLRLTRLPVFRDADAVHMHIIHSSYLSLAALKSITQDKPTVWTLHDPWAMTGHCIYPFECSRWKTGCGQCPDLTTPFPMRRDNTKLMFSYKRWAYRRARFEVIVASKWMQDMVDASPLFEGVKTHLVPFGLDLDYFAPRPTSEARKRFGIPDNEIVICFRSVDNQFKGLPYIIEALERIKTKQRVCLLTFNTKGLLERFKDRFRLVEIGWSNDEKEMRDAMNATDIFLMPSTAEAFGVMAIEAFACGKPVIVFDGTSLPEVTFAPDVGISVPSRDGEALGAALQHLLDNPVERADRGRKARAIAEKHYSDSLQADRLASIYESLVHS